MNFAFDLSQLTPGMGFTIDLTPGFGMDGLVEIGDDSGPARTYAVSSWSLPSPTPVDAEDPPLVWEIEGQHVLMCRSTIAPEGRIVHTAYGRMGTGPIQDPPWAEEDAQWLEGHMMQQRPKALPDHGCERLIGLAWTYRDPTNRYPPDVTPPLSFLATILGGNEDGVGLPDSVDPTEVTAWARREMERGFASGPHNPLLSSRHADAERALALARKYSIRSIQKGLFYTFVTDGTFNEGMRAHSAGAPPSADGGSMPSLLTLDDLARCHALQAALHAYPAPLLSHTPTGLHPECTEAFAETWDDMVLPAFNGQIPELPRDDAGEPDLDAADPHGLDPRLKIGPGRPVQTLLSIGRIGWWTQGVCADCVREKRKEWRAEREKIWEMLDEWLSLDDAKDGA